MRRSKKIHCYNNIFLTPKTDAQLGVPFEGDDRIPFGRFKGWRLDAIPAWYLLKIWDYKRGGPQVLGYIAENLAELHKKAKRR